MTTKLEKRLTKIENILEAICQVLQLDIQEAKIGFSPDSEVLNEIKKDIEDIKQYSFKYDSYGNRIQNNRTCY